MEAPITPQSTTAPKGILLDYAPMERRSPWRALMQIPRPVVLAVAVGFLVLVAYVDIVTPTDLSFATWYLVPVILMTWFAGRRAGYLMALVSLATWTWVDMQGTPYTRPVMAYWNVGSRLLFFILTVALLAAFKNLSMRLESRVEERTVALRNLAAQLSEAEDSERRRLAYDIHDGFGQILTLLKLNLAAALPETSESETIRQRISDAVGMVNDLIDRSRTLTFDLHPAMLDHLGLVPTLHRYAGQFAGRTNIDVTVSEDGPARPLPGIVANYLFRSAKELLNNAAKHGAAAEIVIGVHWSPHLVRVVVDDDGRGFNVDEVLAPTFQKGLGLASIRERLRSFGGSLRVESSVGLGTRVVMDLPLAGQENSA
jgi:signal transduction histidine kinase